MPKNNIPPVSVSLFSKMARRFQALRKSAADHFACFLPSPPGKLSGFFLERLFSGVSMDAGQADPLKSLPKNAVIVYVVKHKSKFDFLFSQTRYRALGLPVPRLAFDMGIWIWQPVSRAFRIVLALLDEWIRHRRLLNPYQTHYYDRALFETGCAMLFLVEKKGFYRRFVKAGDDPLTFLIQFQKHTDRPVFLVTQLLFFTRYPAQSTNRLIDVMFGSSEHPGSIKKFFTLMQSPGKTFAELSEPLNLQKWLDQKEVLTAPIEMQAHRLRGQLLLQNDAHRQATTGPVIKSVEEIKESILTTDRMRRCMEKCSASTGEPIYRIRKQADGYINEIAANYRLSMIRFLSVVVKWLVNSMFDGVVVDRAGLSRVKVASQKGSLILVPCHKSHIDYLILSYLLYHNNMACPLVTAGKNLSFWPLGPIFRRGGAFFLRRSFKGETLYKDVFSAYLHKLLEEGFNIELFIEGGRSRSGKLLRPKLGMISMLLDAYRNGACKDMIFVPVYIGYDRIIEEHAYIHEVEGGKKEDENLGQVIRARRFLKKRYGKIYVNFHQPLSLREFLSGSETPISAMSKADVAVLCRNLSWRIINAIDQETVVTPHTLVAAAILNIAKPWFTREELTEGVEVYLGWATHQSAKLADTLILNPASATDHAIEAYLSRKLIEKAPGDRGGSDEKTHYMANGTRRNLLDFYKSNSITVFLPAAFTALAILKKDAFQFNSMGLSVDYAALQTFFKYEFAFDLDRSAIQCVRSALKAFIDDAILMPHPTLPDQYQITSAGYRKLRLFAAFVKPYFESYKVTLQFLKTNRKTDLDTREKLKRIQTLGLQMLKNREIDRIESISRINYTNGLTYFSSLGINGLEDPETISSLETLIQTHLALLPP